MFDLFSDLWIAFLAGLAAPLVAVCVLPLYPAFLAYLSNQLSGSKKRSSIMLLGLIAALGVIVSMFIVGLIFTKLLQSSLTNAIGIISPIAFGILAIVSIFLLFDFDIGKIFPRITAPVSKKPIRSAFLFGLFFGAIVLPCNPAPLIVLFALSTTAGSFATSLLGFVAFGVGMSLPLLIFAAASSQWSVGMIGFLTKYKTAINRIAGAIMLVIALYYLTCVFTIFGEFSFLEPVCRNLTKIFPSGF